MFMTLESYLQQHYSPGTIEIYTRDIEIYLSNCPAAATAVYRDITNYIGALRQRYKKPATLNRILSSIKVYYDWLCDEGIREDNPAKAVTLKDKRNRDVQLQDLFTTEELEQLFHRKERYSWLLVNRNKVLISLLIYQALLPQEAAALHIENINLVSGSIYIKATPKTNARTLSLRPNQVLLFHQYITEIRSRLLKNKTSGSLLIGIRGEPMPAEDITKHVKRSFKNMYPGRKVNAQTIRQSVIANLLQQAMILA